MNALAQLALATLVAPGPLPTEQEALPEASQLLAEFRAALGAPEKLAAVENLRTQGTVRWVGLDGEGTFTNVYAGLHRGAMLIRFESFGSLELFEVRTDGEFVWEVSPLETKVRDGWDGSEFLRRFGVYQHAPWRSMFTSARTVGKETLDGVEHWRIELDPLLLTPAHAGGDGAKPPPPDVWFLNAETKLLRKVVAHGAGLHGTSSEVVYTLGDWRPVDGILYPHALDLTVSAYTMKAVTTSIEHDVELPEDTFAMTDEVRELARQHASGEAAHRQNAITVEQLDARHIASIRVTCRLEEMKSTLSQILPEVFMCASSSGAKMTGPPLVVYHEWGDEIDLEAAVPVADPIEPQGRVKPQSLPAGEAVVAWHFGPYEKLRDTHVRIQAFLKEHGLEQRAPAWEEYVTDPGMEPDPSKWRTKVVWPVRSAKGDG